MDPYCEPSGEFQAGWFDQDSLPDGQGSLEELG